MLLPLIAELPAPSPEPLPLLRPDELPDEPLTELPGPPEALPLRPEADEPKPELELLD